MIQIVIGKPGTGKSYHVVRYIVNYLTTLSKKKRIERRIYTNISIDLDALQDYFDREHINIEVDQIVFKLDETDLCFNQDLLQDGEVKEVRGRNGIKLEINPSSQAFFWNRFPDNALIIIDEIQKYLSSIKDTAEAEEQSLVEYFSLHRHKRHDWIFITQSLMSLSVNVRRVSEKVTETLNSKQLSLPFPISIPMADIQTLMLGFGVQNQVYRVREGRLDGTYRVIFDGPIEVVCMSKEIFDLYKTHTLVQDDENQGLVTDSEIPFELGPGAWRRAVLWFFHKHGFHLGVKIALIVGIFVGLNVWFDKMADGSFFGGDLVAVPQGDAPVKKSFVSSVPSEVSEESLSDVQHDNFDQEMIKKEPINKTMIINDTVYINGIVYNVGDIVPEKGRIKSASARKGIEYEDPIKAYLRDFDEPFRVRRWLRFMEDVVASSERVDL